MTVNPNKWLGIDFGLSRIGIAISDPLGILARGLETMRWNGKDTEGVLERLAAVVRREQVGGVIMGCPGRTDGREASLAEPIRQLSARLEQLTQVPVLLRDERFTTVIARRKLLESGVSTKRHKPVIDQAAAEIILQEHLDSRRHTPS